jgi:metal-dependent amidase/aminoacylase/carboxypeptidase family protein
MTQRRAACYDDATQHASARSASHPAAAFRVAAWLALVLAGLASPVGAAPRSELERPARERVEALRAELIDLRRDLHRHPETSGHEERTAGVVARRLQALGLEVRTGVGGHGVIGVLRGNANGPVVAYRADMDAVPSTAPDPVDFPSVVPGVRHICGHDLHVTIGLALAEALAAVRDRLPGTVVFLFQPAEENATGARAMIADGALEKPRPRTIFGVHSAPLPVGQLGTAERALMASRDQVRVTLSGAGDVAAAAKAAKAALDTVGTIPPAAAIAPAADPDFVFAMFRDPAPAPGSGDLQIQGMFSVATPKGRALARQRAEQALAPLVFDGVTIRLEIDERVIAGIDNDPELTRRAVASVRSALGESAVVPIEAVVPAFSEDFGSFQDQVPGTFFFLGVANAERGWAGMPHSPDFVADEEAIFVGARAMLAVLLDELGAGR